MLQNKTLLWILDVGFKPTRGTCTNKGKEFVLPKMKHRKPVGFCNIWPQTDYCPQLRLWQITAAAPLLHPSTSKRGMHLSGSSVRHWETQRDVSFSRNMLKSSSHYVSVEYHTWEETEWKDSTAEQWCQQDFILKYASEPPICIGATINKKDLTCARTRKDDIHQPFCSVHYPFK